MQLLKPPNWLKSNIKLLADNKTFTITTGHQLNIFTGPLYFIYKIVTAINLGKELKQAFPDYNFVPVYWMATEDHDFEEINHVKIEDKMLTWNKQAAGATGQTGYQGYHWKPLLLTKVIWVLVKTGSCCPDWLKLLIPIIPD